jgi:hypothetical protein
MRGVGTGVLMRTTFILAAMLALAAPAGAAEFSCSGKSVPPVPPSVVAGEPRQLTGEALVQAEQLLGSSSLAAVDAARVGLADVPGKKQYLVRAMAFKGTPNHFSARALDGTVYIATNILGRPRELEPVVLILATPLRLESAECANFTTQ